MKKETAKSYMALISSMLIFGTLGIFRRYIPLSSAMLAFFRGILGSMFLLILVFAKGNKLQELDAKKISYTGCDWRNHGTELDAAF